MGCDIHSYKEKFVGGKWETADKWVPYDYGDDEKGEEIPFEDRFHERNYSLFGLLAGVRREFASSLKPRGVPFDACEHVNKANEGWDSDGHSHSYLYLHELKSLRQFVRREVMPVSGMMQRDQLKRLLASIESGAPNWDLLYPYAQSASMGDWEDFSVEMPLDFMVGDSLDRIIAGFEGIEADNHRFVFWFDN